MPPTEKPIASMSAISQHQSYYDKYWTDGHSVYSGDQQGYAANFRKWMRSELQAVPSSGEVLEVGCGDASFTKCLVKFVPKVTAIDISHEQVEKNARTFPEITFLQHDVAQRLPFRDHRFDVIWCSEVLEHLFDPGFALQEMHRVLAPGGLLLVTVPYHGLFKNVMIALFRWDEHFTPGNPHIRFFTRNTLGRLAAEAGFEDIRMRTCGMNQPVRDLFIATNILLRARKHGAREDAAGRSP
jgi:SAM-dependent methyltransferase